LYCAARPVYSPAPAVVLSDIHPVAGYEIPEELTIAFLRAEYSPWIFKNSEDGADS
jgi:hypothetical protein